MIYLLQNDRRTVTADIPADLIGSIDQRSEELRLAAFRYSSQVVAGSKPSFRYLDEPTHQERQ